MNTLELIKQSYARQLGAAMKTVKECITLANSDTWISKILVYPYWQICYHITFYTDFYFSINRKAFKPAGFHFNGLNCLEGDIHPVLKDHGMEILSKEQVLESFESARKSIKKYLDTMSEEYLTAESPFGWHGFPVIDIIDYNIRHNHHHAGQLALNLRAVQDTPLPWIMRAEI